MDQLHAHEVLHMMEGNSYSESSLREAIIKKFGSQQRFYACSAENMDVEDVYKRQILLRPNLACFQAPVKKPPPKKTITGIASTI